jgi:hypothetical protein
MIINVYSQITNALHEYCIPTLYNDTVLMWNILCNRIILVMHVWNNMKEKPEIVLVVLLLQTMQL